MFQEVRAYKHYLKKLKNHIFTMSVSLKHTNGRLNFFFKKQVVLWVLVTLRKQIR